MRGYFGIGIENATKPMNVGSLFRSAHGFGASFVFALAANYTPRKGRSSDTSDTPGHVPFYSFPDVESMVLPESCALVGVELVADAIELPSFHHPERAAYVLGAERGGLSAKLLARCKFIVKIPTAFSINVGTAGAIVMYDRMICLTRFGRRPEWPGGESVPADAHVFGEPRIRRKMEAFRAAPPAIAERDR
ncbi:MAG: TrmH family RNA methyltransferase [Rhodospirillales bacterium]|nr:TrmH family RNA methyltransferase [Rhodospirillales bacterium]